MVARTTPPPRAAAKEPPRVARAPRVSPGLEIDRALRMFVAARAVLRAVPPTASQHGEAWDEVLQQIEEACLHRPMAKDLGAFVRARVVLEVELDHDLHRRVALPQDLAKRVRRTLRAVDEEVGELRMIAAPGALRPSPRLMAGALILRQPLASMTVSSPFGVRTDPINGFKRFHAGVDLGAAEGVMVYASAPGTVVYAGWQGGYGRHVVVDHGDGIRTHYSHLQDLFVKVGQLVDEREPMAAVGNTGRSTGPHLHFAVTHAAGSFLDPLTLIDVPLQPEPTELAGSEGVPLAMTR
ncbi:MAG: hypothetical protein A2138_02250 [Deltaproteobacteria bacterium RBG_16_71_12]|nr:MAG: hypothetical protein A2138_02250 [Deltaproteobacteria bacterium RBG_16_71_12]